MLEYMYSLDELTKNRITIQKADISKKSYQYYADANLYHLDRTLAGKFITVNHNNKFNNKKTNITSVNANVTIILYASLENPISNISCRYTFSSYNTDVLTTPVSAIAVASSGKYKNVRPKITITPKTISSRNSKNVRLLKSIRIVSINPLYL